MSEAMWNEAVSPYDMLGVDEKATVGEVRSAFYQMSKLYHPDRNQGLDDTATRTEHFVKCKRAYDILRDPTLRKIYDGCLLQREKLARRSMYSAAVSNTSEFRDVVDEQFRDAVLDEQEIRGDALVLCCESCGAPSKFRCNICDMLTCAFCATKPHASDHVPPHYPVRYSPSFRRKIASKDRQRRLYQKQQERDDALRALRKSDQRKQFERRFYKRARSRVKDGEVAGAETKHAELTKCYAWLQSEDDIVFAIWLPFPIHTGGQNTHRFSGGGQSSAREATTKLSFGIEGERTFRVFGVKKSGGGGPEEDEEDGSSSSSSSLRPVVDGRLFYDEIDEDVPLECAIFPETQVVVGRIVKKHRQRRWPRLFEGDSDGLRDTGDHDRHDWRFDGELSPDGDPSVRVYVVDVSLPRGATVDDVDVEVSARTLTVEVKGDWPTWTRHFVYPTKTDDVAWTLTDSDGRVFVSIALTFAGLPTKIEDKRRVGLPLRALFVEDDDDLNTLAFAQAAAYLHYGEKRFLQRDDLLEHARNVLKALELDRPRHKQAKPLASFFSSTRTTDDGGCTIKRWYNRRLLEDEAAWRENKKTLAFAADAEKKKKKKMFLRRKEDIGGGGPVSSPAPRKIDSKIDSSDDTTLHLFDDSRGLEREDVATFAWDDGNPMVKVYLSLNIPDLSAQNVSVRFEANAVAVHVKQRRGTEEDKLLCFQRTLFHAVVPKKSTLKIHKAKGLIALGLQKKQPDLPWTSLARNVNALETTSTAAPAAAASSE